MILQSAKDVGAFVRERRTEMGLSQLQLAEKVGVSRVWMVQFEKGKPNAQLGLVLRTLRELKVPFTVNTDPEPEGSGGIDLGAIIARNLEKI